MVPAVFFIFIVRLPVPLTGTVPDLEILLSKENTSWCFGLNTWLSKIVFEEATVGKTVIRRGSLINGKWSFNS